MDTSYGHVDRPSVLSTFNPPTTPNRTGRYLLGALAIIGLIGSIVATGVLYSHLGPSSLAIAGGGVALALLCFVLSRYCSTTRKPTSTESRIPPVITTSSVTATPKPDKPPRLVFPPLKDFTFEEIHSLSKSLPVESFRRPGTVQPDEELLDISLKIWIDAQDPVFGGMTRSFFATQVRMMEDPLRRESVALINARIDALEEAIQLKERLQQLEKPTTIRVKDLLPAWNASSLKYSLATDEELAQLKLLKGEQINVAPKEFHPVTFLIIPPSELKKIETQHLSTEQLHQIFSSAETLHSLEPGQVNACIHLITDKTLFAHLNDAQVVGFERSKMDQAIFNVLFDPQKLRSKQLLERLEGNVIDYFPFFGDHFWKDLSAEQLLKIDYLKVDQNTFNRLFSRFGREKVFEVITDEKLLTMKPLLLNRPELEHALEPEQAKLIYAPPPPPPLPHLLNVKIEAPHPLAKELSVDDFLKRIMAVMKVDEGKALVLSPMGDLLQITLDVWIKRPTDTYYKKDIEAMDHPLKTPQVELINQRIEALDQAIQLKERIKRLKGVYIYIKDLLPAWSKVTYKLKLIMDDELSELKVTDVASLGHDAVWNAVGKRITPLSTVKPLFAAPATFNKESIGNLLLVDLPKLTAEQIHQAPQEFPPYIGALIDVKELQKIDTAKLSKEQLHFLFSIKYYDKSYNDHYYSEQLTPAQILACAPLIEDKTLLRHTTKDQRRDLDASKLTQELFAAIYSPYHSDTREIIKGWGKKMQGCIHCFGETNEYWTALDDEQILDLDYTLIPESMFRYVFNPYKSSIKKLFEKTPDAKLLSVKHLIDDDLKSKLSPAQKKLLESS